MWLTGSVRPMKFSKVIFDGPTASPTHFPIGFQVGRIITITISSPMMMVCYHVAERVFLSCPMSFHFISFFMRCVNSGLSAQDCVELRRYFRIPPAIQAKTKIVPVTLTYMWNDRDCNEKNFFLCERPLSDGKKIP